MELPEGKEKDIEGIELAKNNAIVITQVYDDNSNALDDYNYGKDAAKILNANYFGPDDEWDLNKDPENENITLE